MHISIYTDGACSGNPGPGGWAAVFVLEEESKAIVHGGDPDTTNNRMELMAVVEALKHEVVKYQKCLKRVDIYCDSAYVVNCINNGYLARWAKSGWLTGDKNPVKNKDLWVELLMLFSRFKAKGTKINMIKVKGHKGERFNEMADQHARKAVTLLKTGERTASFNTHHSPAFATY